MRILVTRPRADAEELTKLLVARGHDVIAEPLLEIVTLPGEPVAADGVQAILFTSANGVRALVERNGGDVAALQGLPVYAVGDATARAARDAGFKQVEAANGDVNGLAALVVSRRAADGGPLLHVAGSHVAGDLAGLLSTQGFTVTRATLYEAKAAEALTTDTAGALRRGDVKAALFFSPRTATSFVAVAGAADLAPALGRTTAICLSPAVAEAIDELPGAASWRDILTASEPTQEALLIALDRFVERETRPAMGASLWTTTEGAPTDVEAESPTIDAAPSDSIKPDAPKTDAPPQMPPPIFTSSTAASPDAEDRPSWQSRVALALIGLLFIGGLAVYLAHPGEMRKFFAFEWLSPPRGGLTLQSASPAAPETATSNDKPADAKPDDNGLGEIAKESDKSVEAMRQDLNLSTSPLADDEQIAPVPYEAPSDQQAATPAPAEPAPELMARLDSLEERLARLADRPAIAPETLQQATDTFATRLTRLDETLSALTQKIETQSAEQTAERARLARAEALALNALLLRDSLDHGTPFPDAVPSLRPLAEEAGLAPQADLVVPAAGAGLAPIDDLHNRLLAFGSDVARSEAGPKDNGILARLGRSLSSVVVVRRVDDDTAALNADDPADRLLARADRRLLAGDLAEAIAPIDLLARRESLTPTARAAIESWLRDARARRAAEDLQAAFLQRGLAMRQVAPR